MRKLYSTLKSRDITLPTKVHLVKASFSSSHVWMWEVDRKEDWCWGIDAFKLWCWKRLLRVPWITGRSNQSILKEINLEYSPEGLMLKLKLQYFGHLMRRTHSLEKILMLGKIEGRKKRSDYNAGAFSIQQSSDIYRFVVVQSLSHVPLFATPQTAACQASLTLPPPRVCSNSCALSQ